MKKYEELDRLLSYMEENIDLNHIKKSEALQYDCMMYKNIPHLPLTIRNTPDGFEQVILEEAFNSPELMLYNELLWSTMHSSYNSVRTKDDSPLMVRVNLGIGMFPSLFGTTTTCRGNEMPWAKHITWKEALKNTENGVPDLSIGIAGRVIEYCQYFDERLKAYPKCHETIHIQQPDMQGPYDALHLMIGEQAFLCMYDEPKASHEMLEVISDTYVAYRRSLIPYLSGTYENGDASYVHGFLAGGQVLIKSDTAVANLSPDMCEEYELQYERRILDAFSDAGYGSIHCCGKIMPDTMDKIITSNCRSFNFGNPEMHEVIDVYNKYASKNISLIGFGFNQFYDDYHTSFIDQVPTGMSLMAKARSVEDAKEILLRHRGY